MFGAADAAAWLLRVMGPALLLWCAAWPAATAGLDWMTSPFWLWFAPLPYFTAWIAATTGSWRTAAVEGARLAAVHLALYIVLFPFAGILLFLLAPVLIVAAGGALGDELIRRHARFAPAGGGRPIGPIHQIGATLAALCVMLVLLPYTLDGRPKPTPDGMPAWLVVPILTALGYVPHALASWFWQRRPAWESEQS